MEERRKLIALHNSASDDAMYGDRLYAFSQELIKAGRLKPGDDDTILLFSVDWPMDVQIELI